MSAPLVFLDSGIFIALLSARDRWHAQARALFSGEPPRWRTSYLVISEAYSWFLHRHGEEQARGFRALVDALDDLRIYHADAAHHRRTYAVLDRYRGTKLTYVDASSLAYLERDGIGTVWATDHHLGIAGAEVLPRS